MLVAKAINTDTRVLSTTDSKVEAREHMERIGVNNLPVVDAETHKLTGHISMEALQSVADNERLIGDFELVEPIKIFSNQHLFHAIRLMLEYELHLLPVIDDEWVFKGIIEKEQVLESLSKMLNLTEYGSIITVRLNHQDFTLSEVVQLIEAEGGKILGITVETPNAEKKQYEVSIKLNLQDVSRVASALRRYGYTILTEAESESTNIDLETRADELLKFMDM